jgi:arylsulfatase A-like enzyme
VVGSIDERRDRDGGDGLSRQRAGARDPVRRATVALTVAAIVCVASVANRTSDPVFAGALPPNVLLVITDDQPWDTVPVTSGPPAMPWLESRLADPGDHWIRFRNAFLNVPMCCPSRASLLTGRFAHHTGVEDNGDGAAFDESSTLATWLDRAGYQTALIGKYLNGYPWDRGPYVPDGWDRFLAKRNLDVTTTYERFPFVDQGVPLTAGPTPQGYATSTLAGEALAFLRGASREAPWFMVFAPTAPHAPWTPAPQDAGSFRSAPIVTPSLTSMNEVTEAPGWVRALPPITEAEAATLDRQRRRMLETLGAVDRAMDGLVEEIRTRDELGRTLIVFLTDNGFSFGEHRWVGKRCPYDACIRTPLIVRTPWTDAGSVELPVSIVDLAPTILDLVRDRADVPPIPMDGVSLRSWLDDGSRSAAGRGGVLVEWAGDPEVPAWTGIRSERFAYFEHADGTIELFDISGTIGPPDPHELHNRAGDPRYRVVEAELSRRLSELADGAAGAVDT